MRILIILLVISACSIACKDRSPKNVFTPSAASNESNFSFSNPIENDTILYVNRFKSSFVDARNLEVWLPQGYPQKDVNYRLLYMHDGQNVFNKSSSSYGMCWEIDEKMDSLSLAGAIEPSIVVTTWSHPKKRFNEYMPQQPKELTRSSFASKELEKNTGHDRLYSDEYLKFVTQEVLPFVYREFQVSEKREHTTVMGSSMGGLISLYAMMEYPDVFSKAGCLSTHWPVPILGQEFINSLAGTIPDTGKHRIYFDYGTEALDKDYEPYQKQVDSIFYNKGYHESNYRSIKFQGHEHNEDYWRQRVAPVLVYLLND